MVYLQYFLEYGEGGDEIIYALLPENIEPWDAYLISEKSVLASPADDGMLQNRCPPPAPSLRRGLSYHRIEDAYADLIAAFLIPAFKKE